MRTTAEKCPTCKGSGTVVKCAVCNGTGLVAETTHSGDMKSETGGFSTYTAKVCPECNGSSRRPPR